MVCVCCSGYLGQTALYNLSLYCENGYGTAGAECARCVIYLDAATLKRMESGYDYDTASRVAIVRRGQKKTRPKNTTPKRKVRVSVFDIGQVVCGMDAGNIPLLTCNVTQFLCVCVCAGSANEKHL